MGDQRILPRGSRLAAGLSALSAVAAAAVTLSISVSPDLRFAYGAASAYVALETAAGLVAALAAFLALGRFRLTRSLPDLALVSALVLLAVTMLLFFTAPAVTGREIGRFAIWARALGTLFAAVAFVVAAYVADEPSGRRRRRWVQAMTGYGVSALVALGALFALRPEVEIPDELPVESLSRPLLVGSPALLVWHFVTAIALAAATLGFVRRWHERGDGLTLALALGMPLAAGAAIHNFLFPSPYPDYVFAGDLFRLGFFLIVLVGALAQISAYQRASERLGMRRERERLARDLHDGPVQELAVLQILIDQVARRVQDPAVSALDEHAAATLREWRRAVSATALETAGAPLHALLEASARGLSGVTGVAVDVRVEGDGDALNAEEVEDVLYLVREASSNAVRHGGAARIAVVVDVGPPLGILVEDDGCGFDPDAPVEGGHGLVTMRQRARTLGGGLRIESSPHGTRVLVGEAAKGGPDPGRREAGRAT